MLPTSTKIIARVTFAVTETYPLCMARIFTTVESKPIRECDKPGLINYQR